MYEGMYENPRHFKVFVGNRISTIIDLIPQNHWYHMAGMDNPADPASSGMFPFKLLEHKLWWSGPSWLNQSDPQWTKQPILEKNPIPVEEQEISLFMLLNEQPPLSILGRFSSLTRLIRVSARIFCFVRNCRHNDSHIHGPLLVEELLHAERYWIAVAQQSAFKEKVLSLTNGH